MMQSGQDWCGDKRKRGKADRSGVAMKEPYEVNYFARKYGIPKAEALKIIKKAKGNRAKADQLAEGVIPQNLIQVLRMRRSWIPALAARSPGMTGKSMLSLLKTLNAGESPGFFGLSEF
jgi:hypothetical protein